MKRKIKLHYNLLLLFCVFLIGRCTSPDESASESLFVLKNVHTIDAKNGLQLNRTLVWQGNRILQVEAAGSINFSKHAKVLDGAGKFLIPGLWDAHVHLSFEKDLTPAMFQLFLLNGITSIRDTGGQLDLVLPEREKARKDPENSPRVMVAGPLLDGVPTVYDGSTPAQPHLGIGAATPEAAQALVDRFAEAGVDLVKAYEMLTPEAFKAVVSSAKSRGLVVTGHVPLSMDVVEASNAGLRSMEHLRNLEMACSKDWEDLLKTRQKMLFDGSSETGGILRSNIHRAQRIHAVENQDAGRRAEVLRHLAENGTWQIPTLSISTSAALQPFARPEWSEYFQYLPPTVEKRWKEGLSSYLSEPFDAADSTYAQWALQMIGHLKKAGVPILAGTDSPIFFLTPGYSLHEELALLVMGGLTPLEAIEAATLKPAEYFGLEKELGLIEAGMLADLVLLDANPLDDIHNTRKVHAVIRNGKLHDEKALTEMRQALAGRD